MDNASYVTVSRQAGLLDQLDVIATNISNAETTGYRREVTVFSEFVEETGGETGSISMATVRARFADVTQGVIEATGSALDVAIEGDGFFVVETPEGERLTRAGSFTTDVDGALVTLNGSFVLDEGGAQIFIPPNAGGVLVAPDGTISADGEQIGQIALVTVEDPAQLRHSGGVLLISDQPLLPAEGARVVQGFLESSNVDPLLEITHLIEVQRAYELGQSLIEDTAALAERTIRALGQPLG